MEDIKEEIQEKPKKRQKEYMLFGYSGVKIGDQRIVKWDIIDEELYKKFPENIKFRFLELGTTLKKSFFSVIPPNLKSKFKEKE